MSRFERYSNSTDSSQAIQECPPPPSPRSPPETPSPPVPVERQREKTINPSYSHTVYIHASYTPNSTGTDPSLLCQAHPYTGCTSDLSLNMNLAQHNSSSTGRKTTAGKKRYLAMIVVGPFSSYKEALQFEKQIKTKRDGGAKLKKDFILNTIRKAENVLIRNQANFENKREYARENKIKKITPWNNSIRLHSATAWKRRVSTCADLGAALAEDEQQRLRKTFYI